MNHGDLQATATQVRRDIVRMVHAVQSGHPGGSLGCTDLLVQLYFGTMNVNPSSFDMDGHEAITIPALDLISYDEGDNWQTIE